MIIATANRQLATLLTAGLLSATALRAQVQDVYLSEIRADASETWIELHNRGSNPVDISQWSLHCATTTASMPQTYWWPFPLGTTLAPDAFLRVHWFQSEPAVPVTGNLYTGTSPYGFLFGLGGEALSGNAGAAALIASQANAQMNSPTVLRDSTSDSRSAQTLVDTRWWQRSLISPLLLGMRARPMRRGVPQANWIRCSP